MPIKISGKIEPNLELLLKDRAANRPDSGLQALLQKEHPLFDTNNDRSQPHLDLLHHRCEAHLHGSGNEVHTGLKEKLIGFIRHLLWNLMRPFFGDVIFQQNGINRQLIEALEEEQQARKLLQKKIEKLEDCREADIGEKM